MKRYPKAYKDPAVWAFIFFVIGSMIMLEFILPKLAAAHDLNRFPAEVYRVVDGDTVDMIIEPMPKFRLIQRVRLFGVNAPESRTSRACEKIHGTAAKHWVIEWLANSHGRLWVEVVDGGKYAGRVIGNIVRVEKAAEINLSTELIKSGNGVLYYGGKREPWKWWMVGNMLAG